MNNTPALVFGSLCATAILVVATLVSYRTESQSTSFTPNPCGSSAIPEGTLCIPFPVTNDIGKPNLQTHVGFTIPRRPDRPEDFGIFHWPVAGVRIFPIARSIGQHPTEQNFVQIVTNENMLRPVSLDGQIGEPRVVFTGSLVGLSVATVHRVKENNREQMYLVVYGNLTFIQGDIVSGRELDSQTILGRIDSSENSALWFGVFLVRNGVDVTADSVAQFDASKFASCDPRNVLLIRQK